VVGDFHEWNRGAHPMKQTPDRSWLLTSSETWPPSLCVSGGRRVDARPPAQGGDADDKGERVSLVPVS